MSESYLNSALESLQGRTSDLFSAPDRAFSRKVTVTVDLYSVFLLERFAAHCCLSTSDLARTLLVASLNDASSFLRDNLSGDLDEEGDEFLTAYRAMCESQSRLNALLKSWRGLAEAAATGAYPPIPEGEDLLLSEEEISLAKALTEE